jgi:tetratricopeptide (TPR) repeat protein
LAAETVKEAIMSQNTSSIRSACEDLMEIIGNIGADDRAIELVRTGVALVEQSESTPQPDTLAIKSLLANAYCVSDRSREALELRESIWKNWQILDRTHEMAIWAKSRLADSYYDTGSIDKAIHLQEEVLKEREVLLGSNAADTIEAMDSLADSYSYIERHEEAVKLREQVLNSHCERFGRDSREARCAMETLAESYKAMGYRTQEASTQTEM